MDKAVDAFEINEIKDKEEKKEKKGDLSGDLALIPDEPIVETIPEGDEVPTAENLDPDSSEEVNFDTTPVPLETEDPDFLDSEPDISSDENRELFNKPKVK